MTKEWLDILHWAKYIRYRLDTTEAMESSISGAAYNCAERAVWIESKANEMLKLGCAQDGQESETPESNAEFWKKRFLQERASHIDTMQKLQDARTEYAVEQWQYRVIIDDNAGAWINCSPEAAKRLQESDFRDVHEVRALAVVFPEKKKV